MMTNQDSGIAEIIPGYLVLERLGVSNRSAFYGAVRKEDGAAVVIKTLNDKYPQKEDLAGLQREYRISSRLQGEGIIRVYALVSHGQGNPAIVMERFGIALKKHLAACDQQRLPLNEFIPLALRL